MVAFMSLRLKLVVVPMTAWNGAGLAAGAAVQEVFEVDLSLRPN
jgi:hypothetical protein